MNKYVTVYFTAVCVVVNSTTGQVTPTIIPVTFEPHEIKLLLIDSSIEVTAWSLVNLRNVTAVSDNSNIATASPESVIFSSYNATHFSTRFNVTGIFMGYTTIYLKGQVDANELVLTSKKMDVSIIRKSGILDRIFVISVATLVSLIYVNFGCALNWRIVKETLRRPISPAIGFLSQFGFMPLVSFLLGQLLFPDNVSMQLGLFFTGCSPGGGASNMWTVQLGGNLDLSITMTTISTFFAFVMIPLWVFTLGKVIFQTANFSVPYSKISQIAIGLIVPLIIGTLIQFRLPKISSFMVKILKPFALFLIIFIVIFATVINFYIFSLLDWRTMLAGLCIPWMGYLFGATLSRAFHFTTGDIIAIAVETGVQNTGIAFYMLRVALEQPAADLAQVCPVAVSLMTPIPLAIFALIRHIQTRRRKHKPVTERIPSTELVTPSVEQPLSIVRNYNTNT